MFHPTVLRLLLLCLALADCPAKAGEISGILREVTGAGISNVMVRIDVFGSVTFTQMVATTDVAGRFSFLSHEGTWVVQPDASSLNALGYLDVMAFSFSVSNDSRGLRFTTRKLDLSRRIVGRVIGDAQESLSGIPLRAFITENGQRFETNFATGLNGTFSFPVSPALWRIERSPLTEAGNLVFPEVYVPVEATDSETMVTIVAPRATSTITGVATNLAGYDVVAECEAHGVRYSQSANLWRNVGQFSSAFSLPVFNGVWTVSVTNRFNSFQTHPNLPPPVVVHVTNQTVALQFDRPAPSPTEVVVVKVLAADGTVVTNSSVYASTEFGFPIGLPPQLPGSPPPDLTVTRIPLDNGQWTVAAQTSGPEIGLSWSVSRDLTIPLDGASNLNLVIPQQGIGPRITGVVRDSYGVPLPGRYVSLRASEQGTNYSGQVLTDVDGRFALHVVPGHWLVSMTESVACVPVVSVEITTGEQDVALVICPLLSRAAGLIAITAEDEAGIPEIGFGVSLSDGVSYFSTNVFPGKPWLMPLSTGLWTASLSPDWSTSRDDPYRILPTLRFQRPGMDSTNLILVARRSSARIEGRLRDPRGRLVNKGQAMARASIGGTNYSVNGQVASGYFSLNVIPGDWQVAAST